VFASVTGQSGRQSGSVERVLLGRHGECEALDRLVASIKAGDSRALVIRGEPGVGKTALLEYLIDRSSGCRLERAAGVQSEMELAFAGLHQLCAPMLDRLERLPLPQRDALATAFGIRAGAAPDRFLIGLAVLNLLSEVAEDQPLLCVVDDAQWLDQASAQALAFAARRVLAESVGLVFAAREHDDPQELAGLADLPVRGLPNADARALLASVIPGALDDRVRDRIVAETRGNPLALLELPRGLTPTELAGGFGAGALSGRIEDSFRRRLDDLPEDTRLFLLTAAAEPLGDPLLLWRAGERLGIASGAATAAVASGQIELGRQVRFRHPLVRSAVYDAAHQDDRRRVHAALAAVTDPVADPDRRAWHRAQAAAGPDEDVAAELARSADRAQARGGLAAAAAFLEQATALTLAPAARARRALAAAHAKQEAGAFDTALRLLAEAEAGPLDELEHARVAMLRAHVAFARGDRDASVLLLEAAERLQPLDPDLARETYLEALSVAMFAGRVDDPADLQRVAAKAAAASVQPDGPAQHLLDGLALLATEGRAAATAALQRALRAFREKPISREASLRWLWIACIVAFEVWDERTWELLSTRQLELARESGALAVVPIALMSRIGAHLETGRLAEAWDLVEEQDLVAEITGTRLPSYRIMLAGLRGDESEVIALAESIRADLAERGDEAAPALDHAACAILYNGLKRYDDALAEARRATARTWGPDVPIVALIELVEAAARSGQREEAVDALEQLAASTRASGTNWALGIETRCRALLSEGETAERLYREAIARLERTPLRLPLARAHLLYGEWLRREGRRVDAREHLRTAHEMYAGMGAGAHAERAAVELRATGETARQRAADTREHLTAQEAQIARLAREGLSNPEIGTRLFISPRTVQYHLGKVFAKLGISSRSQLDRALPG
jgi:DNA-binding CsgD family transcriptional regulator